MIRAFRMYDAQTVLSILLLLLMSIGFAKAQGSDAFSTTAPTILFNPTTGDLSTATKEITACTFGANINSGGISGFSNNYLFQCLQGASCTTANTNDKETDNIDLWYKVILPTGTTQMTLIVTGLGANQFVAFALHTANPGNSNSANLVPSTGVTVNGGANTQGGIFSSTKTSNLVTGLAAGGTYYIRIVGVQPDAALGCGTVPHPAFTIEARAPQANDACANAINITTNNSGAAHTGNYTAAASEAGDEWTDCTLMSKTAANDLWYRVNYPAAPSGTYLTELALTGTAGQQVRVVVYDVTAACGGTATASNVDFCEEITLTGSTQTTTFGNLTSVQSQSRLVQIIPINTVGNLTVAATVVAANNECAWFNQPFPGFGVTSPQVANFNFSTTSTAYPTEAGKDLWYHFDPIAGTDNGTNVYSTSADITVSGLAAGQSLTFYLYKRNGYSGNCTNLSTDYISQTNVTTNGTFKLLCLDELHGTAGTGDGYLLRVVQTAGTTATAASITVTPSAVGPYNNDCTNIWDGDGPRNTGSDDAAHGYSAWHFLSGETLVGSFAQASDCNPAITSSMCSGVGNTPATGDIDNKDVWFTFKVPENQCSTLGLTQSTVVSEMKFTYTANPSSSFNDARIYIYSDCGDANLVACSGVLDGANTAGTGVWTATGLTQGQNYLVRVKPSSTNTNFSFNFDLKIEDGVYRPCNDAIVNAATLTVPNCPMAATLTNTSYTNLLTNSAKGASPEVSGSSDNTVWFKFTAPDPANGGDYSGLLYRSWVTVFLEGQSNHLIEMTLYEAGGTTQANGQTTLYSVNGIGDRTWGWFGNLTPGAAYMIRLKHNQVATVDVKYKIDIWAGGSEPTFAPLACGDNDAIDGSAAKLCGSCGNVPYDAKQTTATATESLCEEWYKIDLPWVTSASTKYWVIEVRGFKQMLDFELRKQVISETINPGGADYDHPCWSRILPNAPTAADEQLMTTVQKGYTHNGTSYSLVDGNYLEPGSCNDLAGMAPHSGGYRKVYRGLVGSTDIPYTKNYYYIRVFMNPNDPQFATCEDNGGINTCQVIFKGPYSTQALAQAGGIPDAGNCSLAAYAISGNVYHDTDGLSNNLIDGTGIGNLSGTPLYANLVQGGVVIQSVLLPSNGAFTFNNVPVGTYTVVVATSATAITSTLTGNWIHTGEAYGTNNAAGASIEAGLPNGAISVIVGSADVNSVEFGIEQRPVVTTTTATAQNNPGGTATVNITALQTAANQPLFGATDPDGTVSSITLTTFPTNVTTLFVDGVPYTSATFPSNGVLIPTDAGGVPTVPILIDPVDGLVNIVFDYITTDAAGITSTPATTTVPFATALPIAWAYIVGEAHTHGNVLKWGTHQVIDVQEFVIERSANGIQFTKIGSVDNTTDPHYTFTDKTPLVAKNYYRVGAKGTDEQLHYSAIVIIDAKSATTISIYPNPAHQHLLITHSTKQETLTYRIIDSAGKEYLRGIAEKAPINIQTLPSGVYMIEINETTTLQFIKQ